MIKVPVLSFFTGGGFLDLGFHMNNFNIVWTNEANKQFAEVYKSGMSSCLDKRMEISTVAPIQDVDYKDINNLSGLKDFQNEIWGIIGGPPCPDFSVGGKHKGKNGEKGILSSLFVDIICNFKPSFFIFENVKGLISVERHKLFFDELVLKLEKSGYAIDYRLLNALEVGVPQDRERVIMIGVREHIYTKVSRSKYRGQKDWFYWPFYNKYKDAKTKYNWPSVTPIGENTKCPTDIPKELMTGYYILNQKKLETIANSNEFFVPKSDKFHLIPEGDDKRKSFKRLHRWRYSPTIAYGNNEVHLHPVLPRRLTVREALRLQTVPDRYDIEKNITLSDKFKVIGNGVPVKLSYNIANCMKRYLDNYILCF